MVNAPGVAYLNWHPLDPLQLMAYGFGFILSYFSFVCNAGYFSARRFKIEQTNKQANKQTDKQISWPGFPIFSNRWMFLLRALISWSVLYVSGLVNQRARKVLFTCVVYTNGKYSFYSLESLFQLCLQSK